MIIVEGNINTWTGSRIICETSLWGCLWGYRLGYCLARHGKDYLGKFIEVGRLSPSELTHSLGFVSWTA